MFAKLKEMLTKALIGVGCPGYVLNNITHEGTDHLPIDLESIIVRVYNYFSIYTVRTKELEEFCDSSETIFRTLLKHSKSRWLSLFPAVHRFLQMCDPLKSYFLSIDKPPKVLQSFFESRFRECYLWAVHFC